MNSKSTFDSFYNELKCLNFELLNEDEEREIFVKKNFLKFITTNKFLARRGNMVSLRGLCYYLSSYVTTIYKAREKFEKSIKKNKKIEFRVKVQRSKDCSTYVFLKEDSWFSYDGTIKYKGFFKPDFEVVCKDVPKLECGSIDVYNKVKKDIYEFLNYVIPYVDYINKLPKIIHIGERTIVKIQSFNLFKNEGIMVSINFNNFSILEINIKKGKTEIITFSTDSKVSKFLEKNKEKLLDEIFIPEEKISDILEIIN